MQNAIWLSALDTRQFLCNFLSQLKVIVGPDSDFFHYLPPVLESALQR
jgi:hypothetical protein